MYASDWIMDFLLPEVWYAVHVSCVVESAQPVTYMRATQIIEPNEQADWHCV